MSVEFLLKAILRSILNIKRKTNNLFNWTNTGDAIMKPFNSNNILVIAKEISHWNIQHVFVRKIYTEDVSMNWMRCKQSFWNLHGMICLDKLCGIAIWIWMFLFGVFFSGQTDICQRVNVPCCEELNSIANVRSEQPNWTVVNQRFRIRHTQKWKLTTLQKLKPNNNDEKKKKKNECA